MGVPNVECLVSRQYEPIPAHRSFADSGTPEEAKHPSLPRPYHPGIVTGRAVRRRGVFGVPLVYESLKEVQLLAFDR
jgi:hypothetical protein